jgi:hypothetical protein
MSFPAPCGADKAPHLTRSAEAVCVRIELRGACGGRHSPAEGCRDDQENEKNLPSAGRARPFGGGNTTTNLLAVGS